MQFSAEIKDFSEESPNGNVCVRKDLEGYPKEGTEDPVQAQISKKAHYVAASEMVDGQQKMGQRQRG